MVEPVGAGEDDGDAGVDGGGWPRGLGGSGGGGIGGLDGISGVGLRGFGGGSRG